MKSCLKFFWSLTYPVLKSLEAITQAFFKCLTMNIIPKESGTLGTLCETIVAKHSLFAIDCILFLLRLYTASKFFVGVCLGLYKHADSAKTNTRTVKHFFSRAIRDSLRPSTRHLARMARCPKLYLAYVWLRSSLTLANRPTTSPIHLQHPMLGTC